MEVCRFSILNIAALRQQRLPNVTPVFFLLKLEKAELVYD